MGHFITKLKINGKINYFLMTFNLLVLNELPVLTFKI